MQLQHQGKPHPAPIRRWLKGHSSNIIWWAAGVVLGVIADPFLTDRALPFVYRPSAEITPITQSRLGREVELNIRTKSSLPGHSYYVVVQSGQRYWPQAPVESNANRRVMVKLGAIGSRDVGSTFVVHVVDVSGAAEALIVDYFVNVDKPGDPVRHSGIDLDRVRNRVDFLTSETLRRMR
jgi:hypothetical protein